MSQWIYTLVHLLLESFSAHRDAQIRFLKEENRIRDRDTKFTAKFDQLLGSAEIKIVKSPVMAPNANAFAESWIATVRRECLDHFACFSLRHTDHIMQVFVSYYNKYRPHQSVVTGR